MSRIEVKSGHRRQRMADARQTRRRLRPSVMALEGRELLSTLSVNNTSDSGAGSLRTAASASSQHTVTASALGTSQTGFSLTNTENPNLVVNTTKDLPLPVDGENSLRTAIEYADLLTGPQTITFDPAVFGTTPQTITLTYGALTMNNPATTTIRVVDAITAIARG